MIGGLLIEMETEKDVYHFVISNYFWGKIICSTNQSSELVNIQKVSTVKMY